MEKTKKRRIKKGDRRFGNGEKSVTKKTRANGGNSFYKDFQKKTQANRTEAYEEAESYRLLPEMRDPDTGLLFSPSIIAKKMLENKPKVFMEIARRYAAGERLIDFLGKPGFPLWKTYCNWRFNYPEFREMMEKARLERAAVYADQLEHVADNVDASNSKAGKVRADILRHLAAVSDPDKFGNRTKVVGDANAPIAFTVVTGVPNGDGGETPIPVTPTRVETVPLLSEGPPGSEDPGAGGGEIHLPSDDIEGGSLDGDRTADPALKEEADR